MFKTIETRSIIVYRNHTCDDWRKYDFTNGNIDRGISIIKEILDILPEENSSNVYREIESALARAHIGYGISSSGAGIGKYDRTQLEVSNV